MQPFNNFVPTYTIYSRTVPDDLAWRLKDLKGKRERKDYHWKKEETKLSRTLCSCDLGLKWLEQEKLYVVFDLDSEEETHE